MYTYWVIDPFAIIKPISTVLPLPISWSPAGPTPSEDPGSPPDLPRHLEVGDPTKTWEISSFNSHPDGIRFTYTSMVLNVISGVKNSGNSFDCFVDAILPKSK